MRYAQNYVATLLAAWALAAIVIAASYAFLWRSGELASLRHVVDIQVDQGGVYSSALFENTEEYKLALYKRVRPQVAIVGSSRVMQFRDTGFIAPFLSIGVPTSGLAQLDRRVASLLDIHRPGLVLLGLDFWWFAPGRAERTHPAYIPPSGRVIGAHDKPIQEKLVAPLRFLADGRLRVSDVWDVVRHGNDKPDGLGPRWGIAAIVQDRGFLRDGSFVYPIAMLTTANFQDGELLTDYRRRVAGRAKGFEGGTRIDPQQWALLEGIVDHFKRAGVELITFLPPLAGAVLDDMAVAGADYSFVEELRSRLPSANENHLDFMDLRPFGAGDCEFIDGMHVGDVGTLRMLILMADRYPALARVFDRERSRELVARFSGRAVMVLDMVDGPARKEADFLGLGCRK